MDPAAAARLAECFARGDAALRRLAPDQVLVLWPEHFDLSITVDASTTGLPGRQLAGRAVRLCRAALAAYRGVLERAVRRGRPLRELTDVGALTNFFTTARDRAAADPAR